ncbi:MAG TPA: type IV pilin protein [Burkholderiaceae bacterium]|jgi:type IV pilus assembly protein PilE|nr:type IV pilin protein [Burkholderiaceae bacterium]
MKPELSRKAVLIGRNGSSGFTLLELLVTVVLIGVLAAIAIPSYSAYVARGQRAAAKAALMQTAQFLERNYTAYGSYSTGASGVAVTVPTYAPTDGGQITYALAATVLTPTAFTLTATPCATAGSCPAGSNSTFSDAACGQLTLDNTGSKTAAAGTVDACWGH